MHRPRRSSQTFRRLLRVPLALLPLFLIAATGAPQSARAQEAEPPAGATGETVALPAAFFEAMESLSAGEGGPALRKLRSIEAEPGSELAARVAYATAVALTQQERLDDAVCAWSLAVQQVPGLAAVDPSPFPAGNLLAARLGLGGELPTAPAGATVTPPEPLDTALHGPYTPPTDGEIDPEAQVVVHGLVLPDGRFVARGVEAADPALGRLIAQRACRWTFEPARVADGPVAVRYDAALGSEAELRRTLGPLDLATVELPKALERVREHLLAGRWQAAADAAPGERWVFNRPRGEAGIGRALTALAHERLGDQQAARCLWAEARHIYPELSEALFDGTLAYRPPDAGYQPSDAVASANPFDMSPPRKTKTVDPVYSESMLKRRVEGQVNVSSMIGRNGELTDVKVLKSDDPEMSLMAIRAVCQWEFEPATLDGEPVPIIYNAVVNFRLE